MPVRRGARGIRDRGSRLVVGSLLVLASGCAHDASSAPPPAVPADVAPDSSASEPSPPPTGTSPASTATAPSQPANVRRTFAGRIEPGDHVLPQDNSLYDPYDIEVCTGCDVRVEMTSDDFDTYLLLVDDAGRRVSYNDDDASLGGRGTNSRLRYRAERAGRYTVYANSYEAGMTGRYQLTIEIGPGAGEALGTGASGAGSGSDTFGLFDD